jgi:hypothetical protein
MTKTLKKNRRNNKTKRRISKNTLKNKKRKNRYSRSIKNRKKVYQGGAWSQVLKGPGGVQDNFNVLEKIKKKIAEEAAAEAVKSATPEVAKRATAMTPSSYIPTPSNIPKLSGYPLTTGLAYLSGAAALYGAARYYGYIPQGGFEKSIITQLSLMYYRGFEDIRHVIKYKDSIDKCHKKLTELKQSIIDNDNEIERLFFESLKLKIILCKETVNGKSIVEHVYGIPDGNIINRFRKRQGLPSETQFQPTQNTRQGRVKLDMSDLKFGPNTGKDSIKYSQEFNHTLYKLVNTRALLADIFGSGVESNFVHKRFEASKDSASKLSELTDKKSVYDTIKREYDAKKAILVHYSQHRREEDQRVLGYSGDPVLRGGAGGGRDDRQLEIEMEALAIKLLTAEQEFKDAEEAYELSKVNLEKHIDVVTASEKSIMTEIKHYKAQESNTIRESYTAIEDLMRSGVVENDPVFIEGLEALPVNQQMIWMYLYKQLRDNMVLLNGEITSEREKNSALTENITNDQRRNAQLITDNSNLTEEIDTLKEQNSSLTEQNSSLTEQNSSLTEQNAVTDKLKTCCDKQLEENQRLVDENLEQKKVIEQTFIPLGEKSPEQEAMVKLKAENDTLKAENDEVVELNNNIAISNEKLARRLQLLTQELQTQIKTSPDVAQLYKQIEFLTEENESLKKSPAQRRAEESDSGLQRQRSNVGLQRQVSRVGPSARDDV